MSAISRPCRICKGTGVAYDIVPGAGHGKRIGMKPVACDHGGIGQTETGQAVGPQGSGDRIDGAARAVAPDKPHALPRVPRQRPGQQFDERKGAQVPTAPALEVQLVLSNGDHYTTWLIERSTPARLAEDLALVQEGLEDAVKELFFGD